MIIMFNGEFVRRDEAKISMFSEAFMYGFGVFETLRTYNGEIYALDEHLRRLFEGASAMGLKVRYSFAELAAMTFLVARKLALPNQRLKIVAFPEGVLLFAEELVVDPLVYEGVKLKSMEIERSLPELKSIAYLPSYLANKRAVEAGFYDALLVTCEGFVTEGAYCNVFWFEGEVLCTTNEQILKGVTRERVIEASPFEVKFKKITLAELKKHEVFLTQTTKWIVPVIGIDDVVFSFGEKTRKLMALAPR